MKKPRSRKQILLIVLAIVIVVFIVISIFNRLMTSSEKLISDVSRDTWPVNVQRIRPQSFTEKIMGTAILKPMEEAILSSEVVAKVIQIKADLGDRVKKGQILVRLDSSVYSLSLQSAQAQVNEAQSAMDVNRDQFSRKEKLANLGHISQEELELSHNNFLSAKARLKSAQANLSIAKHNLRETAIRAPFAGRVSSRTASPGELVSPGTPVITLVKDDIIRVDLALSESQITKVNSGMSATVRLPAILNRVFEGKVTRVGVAAERATGSFPVRIEIDNSNFELLSGMRASIDILLDRKENSIVISRDFLEKSNGHDGVFIVEEKDGEPFARFSPVTLGGSEGVSVLILSGLKIGQSIVVVGQHSIKEGSKLLIVEKDGKNVVKTIKAEENSKSTEKVED